MNVALLRKSSIKNNRLCDRFALFTMISNIEDIKKKQAAGIKIVQWGGGKDSWVFQSVMNESGIKPDIVTDGGIKGLKFHFDNIPFVTFC